jgi:hypothetical protein
MKSLSIKQPWAALIAYGIKDIENRTWRTHFRGKIYIHASAGMTKKQHEILKDLVVNRGVTCYDEENYLTSAIIGEVEIVDCVQDHPSIWAEKHSDFMGEFIHKPIWNWVLANPVLYDKPILNVKGKLSFWEPDICLQTCESCQEPSDIENMSSDDDSNWFCSECWKELSPIMIQETKECNDRDKLSEFGKVVTICQSVYNYEFLITDVFSQNINNTMACMEACIKIAEGYPYVKKCITEDNKFHLILTK